MHCHVVYAFMPFIIHLILLIGSQHSYKWTQDLFVSSPPDQDLIRLNFIPVHSHCHQPLHTLCPPDFPSLL